MKLYAQGDVLLELVADAEPVNRLAADADGAIVLARGEVTGHRHAFYGGDVAFFRDDGLARGVPPELYIGHIKIADQGSIQGPVPFSKILFENAREFHAETDTLGVVAFAKSDATVNGNLIEIAPFRLLEHEEHVKHAITVGTYRARRQRELDAGAARIVAD